ncbi:MAG: SDR family NAD(P)-dependent oxidoreductase [Spirochaetales bacterium]|nr:SDR family NAD(P)-dependent oxidoreductase [Spirochaetales bacterium]
MTGGSSGIGRALALELLRRGYRVAVVSRDPGRRKKIERELHDFAARLGQSAPPSCLALRADVRNYRELRSAAAEVEEKLGAVSLVVHAAGAARPGYADQLPIRTYREQMELNFLGTVHAVRAFGAAMLDRGQGSLVTFSSVAAFLPVFGFSAYAPAKAAVIAYAETIRQEYRHRGVRVHVVCPPDTQTPGLSRENEHKPYETMELSRGAGLLEPEEVARQVLRGVRRGRFLIVPGTPSKLLFSLSRHLPGLTRLLLDREIRKIRKGDPGKATQP